MEGIIIDVSDSSAGSDREIADVCLYAGADNPVTVVGVPLKPAGCALSAVRLEVVNADGEELEVPCVKSADGYSAVIPAAHLAMHGKITKGLRVMADGRFGGVEKIVCLGQAELVIESTTAWAEPGVASATNKILGDDGSVYTLGVNRNGVLVVRGGVA